MEQGKYRVLLAVDSKSGRPIGFALLCESYSLYAEGTCGIIQVFLCKSVHLLSSKTIRVF